MKREEIKALFPDATDEQLQQAMDLYARDINPVKAQAKEFAGELTKTKQELETIKKTAAQDKMTAEEALQAQLESAQKQEREYILKSNRLDARERLVSAGLTETEYSPLLDILVEEDPAATQKAVDSVVELLKLKCEATEKATKEQMMQETPTPQGGQSADAGLTKDSFAKLSYKEQLELVEQNPDLLKTLN